VRLKYLRSARKTRASSYCTRARKTTVRLPLREHECGKCDFLCWSVGVDAIAPRIHTYLQRQLSCITLQQSLVAMTLNTHSLHQPLNATDVP
jgi:hypothetical protein